MVHTARSDAEINAIIANFPGLVVVDAFATWCGPCKALAPKLELMQQAHPNIRIVKIDVEEVSSFADNHDISAMPTLLFFKNGAEVDRVTGANEPLINKTILKHI